MLVSVLYLLFLQKSLKKGGMTQLSGIKYGFFRDRMIVVIAYLIAVLGGWISMQFYSDQELWIQIAIGDFVATVIIFISSMIVKNSSMYDPYWSVLPILILGYILIVDALPFQHIRVILLFVIVVYWGVRLTANWLKTWPGLLHEDWRYIKLSNDSGMFYWPVSFLGIHLFPTILVFMGCLPFIPILASEDPIKWTDFIGFFISIIAIEIERRADNQLRQFKSDANPSKGKVCDIGLWKYSRHPNYFGEITFWGGIFVMAYGLNTSENLIYGIGFLSMIILFIFISIPMMEKRQILKEGYAAYRQQVSMLIPWFRKS